MGNPLLDVVGFLKATADKSEEGLSWWLKSNSEFFLAKKRNKLLIHIGLSCIFSTL